MDTGGCDNNNVQKNLISDFAGACVRHMNSRAVCKKGAEPEVKDQEAGNNTI